MAQHMLKRDINYLKAQNRNVGPHTVKLLIEHIEAMEEDETILKNALRKTEVSLDLAKKDEERAVANADRLQGNIVQLNAERRRLEAEVDAAREAKRVVLPKEVAEDIEKLLKEHKGQTYSVAHSFVHDIGTSKESKKWLHGFRDCNELMNALVNGYTVEEPPSAEDRMRGKMQSLLDHHGVQCPLPLDELSELLVLVAREAVAESLQSETR